MTARGAQIWRETAASLRKSGDADGASACEAILASATVVDRPAEAPEVVTFGATVTLRMADGGMRTVKVVGVDEVGFEPDSVSWVSPLGRALLGAESGSKVAVDGGRPTATVVKFE
jgi:transcription elongation GreA/GreB family factor